HRLDSLFAITHHVVTITSVYTTFSFFIATVSGDIYTLSLHDALPIWPNACKRQMENPRSDQQRMVERSADFFRLAWIQILKYPRSEEHTSELQSRENLVCRLLLEKKNTWEKE